MTSRARTVSPPAALDEAEAASAPRLAATADERPRQTAAELRRSTWWWFRAAAIAITVFVIYQLLVVFAGAIAAVLSVVLYVIFGAILSFIAGPPVDLLVRWLRLPRTLAILLVLGGGLVLLGFLGYLVVGPLAEEARSLANQVPQLVNRAQGELNRISTYLKDKNIPVSNVDLGSNESAITSRLTSVLLSSLTGTLNAVIDVVVTVVVTFWLLKDGDKLRAGFLALLPGRLRLDAEFGLDAVTVVVGGYVRAQLVLAMIIGTMAGIGSAIIGVPFPLVVAIAAGVFELIPIVGPFAGGAVALLLALTVSPGLALATVILFLGIHVVEGYVLAPRIQAKFVQLHPLIALLALFAGIETGGFLGALFAVPAASLVAVFIRAAVGDWRATRPDMFAVQRADIDNEVRRESLLGEFRLFQRSPMVRIRGLLRRRPAPSGTERTPPPD